MFPNFKKWWRRENPKDIPESEKNKITEFDAAKDAIDRIRGKIDPYAKYAMMSEKRKQAMREEKLKKMFPRTMADLVSAPGTPDASNFAMDAGLPDVASRPALSRDMPMNEVLDRFDDYFIGWQACAILKQNWLIDRAITIPAGDAVAPGFTLAYANGDEEADTNGDGQVSKDEQRKRENHLRRCMNSVDDFNIREILVKAEVTKKTFGYALIVPEIEGADMSLPFNSDGVKRGAYRGMSVIEPMWITPQFDAAGLDPASSHFYTPEYYIIAGKSGKRIHRSWIIKLINSPVPDILKPVYFYGGVPLTQQIFRRVYCAETVANEAPMIAMTKRLLAVEGEVTNAVANPDLFREHMALFTECRDNFGVAMTERGSNLHQIDTGLTDFDQLITTQYQLAASIAQIPVTKLLKVQLKGFDSAGTYEMQDYIQSLQSIQQNDYSPIVKLHLRLYTASETGVAEKLSVNWNPVDTPSEKEKAEIRMLTSQRDVILASAGIIAAEEARERMRNDADSLYTSLPAELPELDWDEVDTGEWPHPGDTPKATAPRPYTGANLISKE